MQTIDKIQLVLEGRCPECEQFPHNHDASQCSTALAEFRRKLDNYMIEILDRRTKSLDCLITTDSDKG
jgi:hypothetical protein